MPLTRLSSRRNGRGRRAERALRERHAGPAPWTSGVLALLRLDQWSTALLPLRPRWAVGGRDGAGLLLRWRGAASPRAGRIQTPRRRASALLDRGAGGGAVAPPGEPRAMPCVGGGRRHVRTRHDGAVQRSRARRAAPAP